MKQSCNVAPLIERYFTERLMRQRNVSANTIAFYRDTFRLLFRFAQARLRKPPSALVVDDLDAPFISAFLADLEAQRGVSARTRNLRLTAIHSFFRFVSFEEPAHSALIQRVLAIPSKRHDKLQVYFLTRPEIEGASGCTRSHNMVWTPRSRLVVTRSSDRLAPLRTDQPRQKCHSSRRRGPCAMCRQGTEGTMYATDRARARRSQSVAQGTGAPRCGRVVPQHARGPIEPRQRPGVPG